MDSRIPIEIVVLEDERLLLISTEEEEARMVLAQLTGLQKAIDSAILSSDNFIDFVYKL